MTQAVRNWHGIRLKTVLTKENPCKFDVSWVYIVSSRLARPVHGDFVSNINKTKNKRLGPNPSLEYLVNGWCRSKRMTCPQTPTLVPVASRYCHLELFHRQLT